MIANWFQDTSVPRLLAGATSAIYIGQMAEAMPTPMPPSTRYRLNATHSPWEATPLGKKRNSG